MEVEAPASSSCDVFSLFLSSLFSVIISATLCLIFVFAIPQKVIPSQTLPRHWIAFIAIGLCAFLSALLCQRRNSIKKKYRQKCYAQRSTRCFVATLFTVSLIIFGVSMALPHLLPMQEQKTGQTLERAQLTTPQPTAEQTQELAKQGTQKPTPQPTDKPTTDPSEKTIPETTAQPTDESTMEPS